MGSDNFWYCWMMGTHPDCRQQGLGKILMNYTFELAKKSHLPCYLETGTEENVIIHQKQGYQVLSSVHLPNSEIKIYCMRKNIFC